MVEPGKLEERKHYVGVESEKHGTMAQGQTSYLKYISLFVLTIQNASLILTIRYSRTLSGDMYLSSTAVVLAEAFKVFACLAVIMVETKSMKNWLSYLYSNIVLQPVDTLKVAVPSFIYVVQNNLQYIAISHLDAATFQVTYQLKILTTALFSVFMLGKSLGKLQWFSLVLLFCGVSLVQLQPTSISKPTSPSSSSEFASKQKPIVGLLAVLASSICSGFAGVYFEKILKGSGGTLWLRNVQLGIFGITIGVIGAFGQDSASIMKNGFLFGYTPLVWTIVCMQAFGGLLVAIVVKYADNILKGFATSFSIILSCIASVFIFHFNISLQFLGGAGCVMLAIYLYSKPVPKS